MIAVALLFALLLGVAYHFGSLPLPLLAGYGVMSLITFTLYGLDKQAAIHGKRRTPELHLQLLALLGGWPGALLAQPLFRHKRRKRPFQLGFWLVSLLNLAVLVAWLIR